MLNILNTDFQTPIWVAEYMISLIPHNCKTVLEPTPGLGNIVKLLDKYDVTAPYEFNSVSGSYDAIVMNPPFTPMKKGYEILYKCMEMSDIIIALMPWLVIINSAKRTDSLINFGLKSISHLPRNVFNGSRVQCCILELNKGYKYRTEFISI